MCLSKAFIIEDNEKKVLCDRVKTMSSEDGKIILKDLFDDVWEIEGQVEEINFVDNYIVLKEKTAV